MTAILGSAAFVAGLVVGWPAPYALAVMGVVAVLLRGERWAMVAVLVACAAAGDLRGSAALDVVEVSAGNIGPFEGTVVTYARRSPARQSIEVETDAGLRLCVQTDRGPMLGRGDVVRVDGEAMPLGSYAPSRGAALRAVGCGGTVDATAVRVVRQGHGWRRWLDDERQSISEWFAGAVPGDRGALLAGLTVGDDDALSFEARQGFFDLGMSHITAVSGSNLALLTWLLLGSGSRRRPFLVDVGTLGLLWGYVFLAGAGPSTIRAGLTATICVLVVRTGRRPDLLTVACLVAAGQVAVDPGLIGSLAYRLSTIAMLVMISTLTGWEGHGWRGKVGSLVACSVAIQLSTLPFTPDGDQAIVAGIVANCLAAPFVDLAFALGVVAAVVQPVSGSIAAAVATVAEIPAGLILDVVDLMDGSALARLRLDFFDTLPRDIVRASLIVGVVLGFGRHARRGVEDMVGRTRAMSIDERLIWCACAGGAILAIAIEVMLR